LTVPPPVAQYRKLIILQLELDLGLGQLLLQGGDARREFPLGYLPLLVLVPEFGMVAFKEFLLLALGKAVAPVGGHRLADSLLQRIPFLNEGLQSLSRSLALRPIHRQKGAHGRKLHLIAPYAIL